MANSFELNGSISVGLDHGGSQTGQKSPGTMPGMYRYEGYCPFCGGRELRDFPDLDLMCCLDCRRVVQDGQPLVTEVVTGAAS